MLTLQFLWSRTVRWQETRPAETLIPGSVVAWQRLITTDQFVGDSLCLLMMHCRIVDQWMNESMSCNVSNSNHFHHNWWQSEVIFWMFASSTSTLVQHLQRGTHSIWRLPAVVAEGSQLLCMSNFMLKENKRYFFLPSDIWSTQNNFFKCILCKHGCESMNPPQKKKTQLSPS